MRTLLPLALAILFGATSASLAEAPSVVATIKPIHSLVAAVMGEVGTPALVVKGAASAHTYSLRPSDAAALQQADLVFWTGHGLELFLEESIDTLAPTAKVVELSRAPGIELLPPREGGAFEPHDDEAEAHDHHAEDDHDHHHGEDGADMHYFLDPQNARAMVAAIAEALAAADPGNAAAYRANAAAADAELDALGSEIDAALAAARDRPFVVFHDAYQYFEHRFGLDVAGSITVSPEVTPGADRVSEIRARLRTLDAACVFAEPQFDPRLVAVLIEGTSAKAGVLDPEGANLDEGPALYRKLLENLATSLSGCLAH